MAAVVERPRRVNSDGRAKARRWLGIALGATMAGFALGLGYVAVQGFETPLFYLAFLVAVVGFITWALSLRKDLASPVSADVG